MRAGKNKAPFGVPCFALEIRMHATLSRFATKYLYAWLARE
jgi:hypothetical protein